MQAYYPEDETEESFSGTKRKSDDIRTDSDPGAEMSNDVLIKTPHFITSKFVIVPDLKSVVTNEQLSTYVSPCGVCNNSYAVVCPP